MPRAKKQLAKKDEEVMNSGYATKNVSPMTAKPSEETPIATASSFDVDAFLDGLFPPPPKPTTNTSGHNPSRPVCGEVLNYDEITKQDGDVWRYLRCPTTKFFTKCFVTCGITDAPLYLDRVRETLHPVYSLGPDNIDPASMRCYCNKSLILALSKSEKNKHRLYFKYPKGQCSFFQWGDSKTFWKSTTVVRTRSQS